MGIQRVQPGFSRMNLFFLLHPARTPGRTIRYFLELSDTIEAYTQVLKVRQGVSGVDWSRRWKYGDLLEAVSILEQGADRPDLIIQAMPGSGLLRWTRKFTAPLNFVKRWRIPVLLVPEAADFCPIERVLTLDKQSELPAPLVEPSSFGKVEYVRCRRTSCQSLFPASSASRFDELGYALTPSFDEFDLTGKMKTEQIDLVLVSGDLQLRYWRALLRENTPVLVCPDRDVRAVPPVKSLSYFAFGPLKKFKLL